MKKTITIFGMLLISLTVFASQQTELCNDESAQRAAHELLRKNMADSDIYTTLVKQERPVNVDGTELVQNFQIKFFQVSKKDHSFAIIGNLEIHPETCKILLGGHFESAFPHE